ncbi:MAG: nicotinate-nucleotide adenylyltransferase [Chloroflexaceae bacterium]|nr:nicotinate-nucleotide adenylyltransferase [Chloroflexaceae bacterium]
MGTARIDADAPIRVGVYGGTFDPIHIAHLAIAEEARWALALHQVRLVPAALQPLKDLPPGATPAQRLAMIQLACADNPAFVPDDLEVRRPPPSYTVETLDHLRARFGPAVELWFIIGADAARDLPRWHRVSELVTLARLAVIGRPGHSFDPLAFERAVPAGVGRYVLLDGPRLDLSSTEIRRRIATGRPVRYLVPEAVRQYIADHGLYREEPSHG